MHTHQLTPTLSTETDEDGTGSVTLIQVEPIGTRRYTLTRENWDAICIEAINGETFDEDTLPKVYAGLRAAGITGQQAVDAVNQMQNQGILFRERAPEPVAMTVGRGASAAGTASVVTPGGPLCPTCGQARP
jgi:hypothetical protein